MALWLNRFTALDNRLPEILLHDVTENRAIPTDSNPGGYPGRLADHGDTGAQYFRFFIVGVKIIAETNLAGAVSVEPANVDFLNYPRMGRGAGIDEREPLKDSQYDRPFAMERIKNDD